MSLAFGRYSARSGLRARGPTEHGSKPGQPCTHGINLGVKKRTSLNPNPNPNPNPDPNQAPLYDAEAEREREEDEEDSDCDD